MDPTTDSQLGEVWRDHHRYVLDVAYRMLGSVSDAEDIVQEAFTRLLNADLDQIEDVRAWLVTVVSRLCIDQLRSARSRREAYVGPWLPEPVIEPPGPGFDPADRVTLDDSVRIALLIVLERLTPAERAAFVLHDVFQLSFEAVGSIVGRSPAACRQLASRARRHIQEENGPARFEVDPAAQNRIAARFVAATNSGDMDALLELLDPDVVGETDSGGMVPGAPRQAVTGRERVARLFQRNVVDAGITLAPMPVNGEAGAVGLQDGRLVAVIALTERDGLIHHIHAIINPYKLAYVTSLLGH